MNFLRHNAKATAKCSRPCENNLRSFVNGGADLSGGSLSTCKSKAAVWGYGFQTLPERPPLRAGIGNVKFKECLYFLSEARRLWCKL